MAPIHPRVLLMLLSTTLLVSLGCSDDSSTIPSRDGSNTEATSAPESVERHVGFDTVEQAADAYKRAFNDRDWVGLARLHDEQNAGSIATLFRPYFSANWGPTMPNAMERWRAYEQLWNNASSPEAIEELNAASYRELSADLYTPEAKIIEIGSFEEHSNGVQINAIETMQTSAGEHRHRIIFMRIDGKVYFGGWSPEDRAARR